MVIEGVFIYTSQSPPKQAYVLEWGLVIHDLGWYDQLLVFFKRDLQNKRCIEVRQRGVCRAKSV